MKYSICYSGNLRNVRMMLNNHINKLFIPLLNKDNIIDVYLYTDRYNTSRTNNNNNINWKITNINLEIVDYFKSRLKNYCNNITINIIDNCEYDGNIYNQNMIGQLVKFYNVLKMITNKYDIIIRLRPDIYFESQIDIKLNLNIIKSENIIYQNSENNYNGDSMQIFSYDYLNNILDNSIYKISELKNNYNNINNYEDIINQIFIKSGLKLIWINNLAYRWYGIFAVYFEEIKLKYLEDWINIEYKFNFSLEKLLKLINIRKQMKNMLIYNEDIYNLENNNIYISGLNPDINNININNNIIYKDIIGLIPCSGTASRINGIPKFLLPCNEGNLINNTINIFKENNIDNIYISVSKENEHHIKVINNDDNDIKYIVKNTNTMSETVNHLVEVKSRKYILIMPDTYFISESNNIFKELTELTILLNKFDIVVILWKIKEYQYGKLGQINIDDEKVLDIVDKDINCKYMYSWGIIGWTYNVNHLIDINTPHIGYLINSALKHNINVGYIISNTEYFDCGTQDEYFKMIKKCT